MTQNYDDDFTRDVNIIHNHEPNPTLAAMNAKQTNETDSFPAAKANSINCTLIECQGMLWKKWENN